MFACIYYENERANWRKGDGNQLDQCQVDDKQMRNDVGGAFRDAFDGLISQECGDVFDKTVELGIENTMRALIEAGVEDSAMASALCKV